ncbi:nadh dehydrogenase [Nannochloropsis oceanica]
MAPSQQRAEEVLRSKLQEENTGPQSAPEVPVPPHLPKDDDMSDYDLKIVRELTQERPYFQFLSEKAVTVLDDTYLSLKESWTAPSPSDFRKSAKNLNFVKGTRQRIVVLGTGWGAHAFLQSVDALKYEVVVVSPRNFMLFTPMLAGSAVGTVEFLSITEPIRNVNPYADYLEATCTGVNAAKKSITCQSVICEGNSCDIEEFELSYDMLLVAVGATTNTYGIPGVKEHCHFLKQINDAVKLRTSIGNAFERANLPGLTDAQRKQALTFVVVGAGPTGVEFTAELRDFVEDDVPKFYPHLLPFVRIKLVEASDRVLMMFDGALQAEAIKRLTEAPQKLVERGLISKDMTQVLLKVGVKEVRNREIVLSDNSTIPYGLAVWAAGNGPLPLVLNLIKQSPEQEEKQGFGRGRLVTDEWMRVKGVDGVFSIGDCCVIDDKPLPANAQAASQQGYFLGRQLSKNIDFSRPIPERVGPVTTPGEFLSVGEKRENGKIYAKGFQFLNLGTLAYTGGDSALAQIAVDKAAIKSSGEAGFLLWRSVYLSKQVSLRNRALVFFDWVKSRLWGRDLTRFNET